MSLVNERQIRHEAAMTAARMMMTSARTAPKAKGVDIIEIVTVEGEDLAALSSYMREYGESAGRQSFLRDALNVEQSECVVLIGTRANVMGLNCGYCGHQTCERKPCDEPCAFNSIDVGIAVGSACAMAADCRVDTRVMYSAGLAAQKAGMIKDCHQVIAILVSVSSKSPYFDRPSMK